MLETSKITLRRGSLRAFPRAAFFAGLTALLLASGCSSPTSAERNRRDKELPEGGFRLDGFCARVYNGSNLEYVLESKSAIMKTSGKEMLVDTVSVSKYTTATGELSVSLGGDRGVLYLQDDPKYDIYRNDFLLEGNVHFSNIYTTVTMPIVRYHSNDPDATFVSGGEGVTLTLGIAGGMIHLKGGRLVVDRLFQSFQLVDDGELVNLPTEPSVAKPDI